MPPTRPVIMIAALTILAPANAQTNVPTPTAAAPGARDAKRVIAGSYKVDTDHTQVVWSVNHLGISPLTGAFGASGGSLTIDPAKPSATKVSVVFTIGEVATTSKGFAAHLLGPDLFDVTKFTTATFTSTTVAASGTSARVTGNLTIKGMTRPVTLNMKFYGAGVNAMSKRLQIGFSGSATIKRSEYGLGYSVPRVSDAVDLSVVGVFEKIG